MGGTSSTPITDENGNVKYSTESIVIPYVTQGQWSTADNYSFLDSRYAPVSGGGYLDKTNFDSTLTESTPYKTLSNNLSTGLDSVNTKYSNMQKTYNSNFSTIANNLGLSSGSDGVVSGTINSSTFVTQSVLNQFISSDGPQTYDENSLNVSKTGKSVKIYGSILFRSGITKREIIFSNFSILKPYSIKSIDSVIIQPVDACDTVSAGYSTKQPLANDGPDYICKQSIYAVKNTNSNGFRVVRPASTSFNTPIDGGFWRVVNYVAYGSLN